MKITHKIKMDLTRQGISPRVPVVQGDAYTRKLEIDLFADKRPWKIPANASVLIRYCKPDRTSGAYDTLADGTRAVAVSGNRISILIAPEALSIAGTVELMVTLLQGEARLSTFSIELVVQADCVSGWDDTESAAWIAAFLPSPNNAEAGQYLLIDSVDSQGHVLSLEAVDAPVTPSAYYTPKVDLPAEDEMLFRFMPSHSDMPTVDAVTVRLPVGPQGVPGEKGDAGEDGLTPYIGDNGNWWIGETDTGTVASGNSGSGASDLPAVTSEDNGKFLQVLDGAWAPVAPLSETPLLEEQTFSGFTAYEALMEATEMPVAGNTYIILWDGERYTCTAYAVEAAEGIYMVCIGNQARTEWEFTGLVGEAPALVEPFVIQAAPASLTGATDMLFFNCRIEGCTSDTHTVGIYQTVPDVFATEGFVRNYVEQYISEALGGDY